MNIIKPKSIKDKLILIILGTTISALIVVSAILIVIDNYSAARSMENRLAMLSRVIADRSTAAITFNDEISAEKMLSVLKEDSSVVLACTFNAQGDLFVSYHASNSMGCPKFKKADVANNNIKLIDEFDYIHFAERIILKGTVIGEVLIIADRQEIKDRLLWFVEISISLILLVMLAAYFLANKLQRYITTPLKELREAAEYISKYNDYPKKLARMSNDEIGVLSQSFHQMLKIIQLREQEQKHTEETLSQSEVRYRTLVQSAPFCIYEMNTDGVFLSMNVAGLKMMGYKNEDEVCGTDYLEKIGVNDRASVSKHLIKTSQGENTHFEFEALNDIGQTRHFVSNLVPLKDDKGHVAKIMGITSNITEQKKAEASLRRSQKMDAIGQLTGGIAHDFNNILGIILGNLELLSSRIGNDDKALKRINSIKTASQRAAKLTRQLLGFSRQHRLEIKCSNINSLIEHLLDLIAGTLTPQVEVVKLFDTNLWDTEIEPGDFEDVLLNLVINARDAMKSNGRLIIETKNCDLNQKFCDKNPEVEPGEYVMFSVTDNGCGMDLALQEHIFEPFFSTKERSKGTGLGLAMVYGFVNRSRGCIKLISSPGEGTRFIIYLPKIKNNIKENSSYLSNTEKQALTVIHDELILIVDDEPELVEVAKECLLNVGYNIITASNGSEALDKLKKNPKIKLLFTDIVMPGGMNGFELAETALQINPTLNILLTSGFTSKAKPSERQDKLKFNMIKKPYILMDLKLRIRDLIDEGKLNASSEDN